MPQRVLGPWGKIWHHGETTWKSLIVPFGANIANKKTGHHSWRVGKDLVLPLKDAGVEVAFISLSNSPTWLQERLDGLCRETMDSHRLNQVGVPAPATVKCSVSGTQCAPHRPIWQMHSFLPWPRKRIRESSRSHGTDYIHFQSCRWAILLYYLLS